MKKIIKTYYLLDNNDVKKIKKFLINKNWNYSSLALELQISDSYVSALITGKRNLTKKLLQKFKEIGIELQEVEDYEIMAL